MMDMLTQSGVTLDAPFTPVLRDLQANILDHHGREFAYHLLLQINDASTAIKWLQATMAGRLTTAEKQLSDILRRKTDPSFDGGTVITLSVSINGYKKLGVPVEKTPDDEAFREGMKSRANRLRDDVEVFDNGWKENGDLFLIIADKSEETALSAVATIAGEVNAWGKVLVKQRGRVLRNKDGLGVEHFGYADGVSQPLFLKHQIDAQGPRLQWDDRAELGLVLKKDPGGAGENSFGSYLVFRKLEQNVQAFKKAEKALTEVKREDGDSDEELGGAMIVGRFESGTEVVNRSEQSSIDDEKKLFNDFDYRDDGTGNKCPFHAHIRMANPRNDVSDIRSHRFARRGIPFSQHDRTPADLDNPDLNTYPTDGVGLLFMCYQSAIPNQFEFVQSFWANRGEVGNRKVGQDGIIGQGPNNTPRFLPIQWGQGTLQANPVDFGHFVTMRGGEYFFTPSISFFGSLP